MTFTISSVADALAGYLSPLLPGVTFYEDPRQQFTALPGCFLQLISSDIKLKTGRRLLRSLRFDLTYLEDYNTVDLQRKYQRVSEILDLNMETFPYVQSSGNPQFTDHILMIEPDTIIDSVYQMGSIVYLDAGYVFMRTYNRTAQIDLDGLHYKFDLQVWLTPEEDAALMRSLSVEVIVRGERN